jgi:hypothetical protein
MSTELHYAIFSCVKVGAAEAMLCEIADFRRGSTEFFRLLRYYAARGALKPTFQEYLSVPSARVKPSNLEDGTDRWSRNIGFRYLTAHNTPEEGKFSSDLL